MAVRAKFRVESKKETRGGTSDSSFYVELAPVINGSPENAHFYKWTPGGKIELATINDSAAAQFKVGDEYYIDFTPATTPQEGT